MTAGCTGSDGDGIKIYFLFGIVYYFSRLIRLVSLSNSVFFYYFSLPNSLIFSIRVKFGQKNRPVFLIVCRFSVSAALTLDSVSL